MALRRYFGKISPLLIGNLVGHNGELVIDEVDNSVYIMDGENPGGFKIFDGHSLQQDLSKYNGNIIPAIDNTYTIGNATNHWTSLYVNDIHSGGNLFIDEFINPTATNNSWGNLRVNASRINADRVYAQTNITTDGSLNANIISANGFVEINASNFSGYTFSGLGIGTTGLIHANVGSVPTIYLATDGNPSFTSYANGYNTVNGYTQFYSNVYVTGDNITIPNNTTIGLLPNFTPLNAKITYVDNVNNYTQVLAQNKNSGSSASGDIVVTADNGSDTTHYIDMGINSSTFAGGGGLDGPGDGYLLVEGGKLVIGTINQPNDIVFAIGGDTPSNEVGRFSQNSLRLNSGGVGVTNSAEFGTQVTKVMGVISHSEIYMGAGTAESRAIVDDQGRSLMYLGTENVGEGKFSGIVARDPMVDSQYSPGLNENNLPTVGIAGDTYATAVGVLNPQGLLNGLYADENQTIITGENNIIINNNGSHPWIFDTVGDLITSGMLRNQFGHRAVFENEIARDISDLTDNYMLLNQGVALDNINIDGGGALANYTTSMTFADGGYSGSRWGAASTVYDGGGNAGTNEFSMTLNGGGA